MVLKKGDELRGLVARFLQDAAFDELEHAVEEGDREHYELDLATWRDAMTRRHAFLERRELLVAPVPTT